MREIIRYGLILGLVSAAASGMLAAVNKLTLPRVAAQAQAEEETAFSGILPQAARFSAVTLTGGEVLYYQAYAKDGQPAGYAFKVSAKGYSSVIEALAGMDLEGKISAVKILSQDETPGLGSRVAEDDFTGQFSGKEPQGLDDLQAISGATISSRAVITAVKEKAMQVKGLLDNGR